MSEESKLSSEPTSFVGIASRVLDTKDKHHLLVDSDRKYTTVPKRIESHVDACIRPFYGENVEPSQLRWFWRKTKNGWHGFFFKEFSFRELLALYSNMPYIDKSWVKLGTIRGYWFLITWNPIFIPRNIPITFMKITWKGGENEWVNIKHPQRLTSSGKEKNSRQTSFIEKWR